MLKKETLARTKMAIKGNTLINQLQNVKTEVLDLFVRESIQNSLDAGFPNKDVVVGFNMGTFDSSNFLNKLDGIKTNTFIRTISESKYLMVYDKNTIGLTGDLFHGNKDYDSSTNNLLKLVYEIGNENQTEGAGGSWGLGKTIYFRMGIGFVVYYSRIKQSNNTYQERLAITLVEDESKKDTILDYTDNNEVGISWWGNYSEEYGSYPITDSNKIKEIIDIFKIRPFSGTETGTKIIIPYVDEKMLENNYKQNLPENAKNYYDNIMDYIEYSVLRWYSPRINNNKYQYGKKSQLKVYTNNNLLDLDQSSNIFKIIQDLYNAAVFGDPKEINSKYGREIIKIENIIPTTQMTFLNNRNVGNLAYGKFTFKDLGMTNVGQIDNPFLLLNKKQPTEEGNPPILMFTRQPGMIVNIETINSDWTHNVQTSPKDEYLIAFFVLNSNPNTYMDSEKGKLSLEQYIRDTEMADHMTWDDKEVKQKNGDSIRPRTIERIKSNISNKLREIYVEKTDKSLLSNVSQQISNLFGSMIMPHTGFGKGASEKESTPSTKSRSTPIQRSSRIKPFRSTILVEETKYNLDNTIDIPFEIIIQDNMINNMIVDLEIIAESGKVNIANYESYFEKVSPISLSNISFEGSNIKTKIIQSQDYETNTGYIIEWPLDDIEFPFEIKGIISIRTTDKSLIPNINIKVGDINE